LRVGSERRARTIVARVGAALGAIVVFATFWSPIARADQSKYLLVKMPSQVLSKFWGQPVSIDAHVLLPDSYYTNPSQRYPVMYFVQGFDGYGDPNTAETLSWVKPMHEFHQEFILIFLDGMFNGGHQEFADSATYGPWGTALTTEFIPKTESHFRALNEPSARFVSGHSSGGWSALWLQVTYPTVFGGEWSISPDPVDFRDFMGTDLTVPAPHNFFDTQYKMMGRPMNAFVGYADWAKRQFVSFESVFSATDAKQNPEPLFDRTTGAVDPAVAHYWEQHYDISAILRDQWRTLGPELRGKIHIFVGGADNFHLDAPVSLLKTEMQQLGADTEIEIIPGLNHWTIFDSHHSIRRYIVQEAIAAYRAGLPPAVTPAEAPSARPNGFER
jgi:pimeloyl-ACP methyl ester carboxylesterase